MILVMVRAGGANVAVLAIIAGVAAIAAATAGGTLLMIVITLIAVVAGVAVVVGTVADRDHRLLEQQRRHRTGRAAAGHMRRGREQFLGNRLGAVIDIGIGCCGTAATGMLGLLGLRFRNVHGFHGGTTATGAADRLVVSVLDGRGDVDLGFLEQRGGVVLHLKFQRDAGLACVAHHAPASTAATCGGYG